MARALVGVGVNIRIPLRATATGKLQYLERGFSMQDTSKINVSDCTVYTDGQIAGTTVNNRILPFYIYGTKR